MSTTANKRHFSMLRDFHLADFFTIANGCCGVVAIFAAIRFVESGHSGSLYLAVALIPVALVFDVLDGRVARWRHKASSIGRELDSLADIISFGVAPATIAYASGLRSGLDQTILIFFVACGLSRLARYNVTAEELIGAGGVVRYFEGTPIPTSVMPLTVNLVLWRYDCLGTVGLATVGFHWASALYFVSGCLMVSRTLRIPKP